ncbi:MAG TPA: endonuclease III domain-containing protein [Thermoplasmata archaeon]|jgi:endonuclease-3 related protein|nr:endonuclease III domain-containing protein [Thermoplasmata archaeon]
MDRETEIFQRLLAHYGPQGWWPAESPFEVIVGAILMPQTAWRNVGAAIGNLRAAGLLDLRALASAPIPEIRKHVKVAGLFRTKPRRLRDLCRHLLSRCDGDLRRYFDRPTDLVRAELLARDGVGPETADSILLYAGGHPVFLVDAYTIRIGRRIGLFDTRRYDDVQRHFERRVPRDLASYQEYHALLVAHAKALCRPKPRCGACPLLNLCAFGRRRGAGRPNTVK